jgi:hypothetical protein
MMATLTDDDHDLIHKLAHHEPRLNTDEIRSQFQDKTGRLLGRSIVWVLVKRARGETVGSKAVDPCALCKTEAGKPRWGTTTPSRYAGSRWGIEGKVCCACYLGLRKGRQNVGQATTIGPCVKCGTTEGKRKFGQRLPCRYHACRFGLAGKVCHECYISLGRQQPKAVRKQVRVNVAAETAKIRAEWGIGTPDRVEQRRLEHERRAQEERTLVVAGRQLAMRAG